MYPNFSFLNCLLCRPEFEIALVNGMTLESVQEQIVGLFNNYASPLVFARVPWPEIRAMLEAEEMAQQAPVSATSEVYGFQEPEEVLLEEAGGREIDD